MKKNFKFLSSLALTGMLATSVMGTPAFAATTENTTKTEPVGIYEKLVTGKKIVPFVLANRDDKVTISDLTARYNVVQFNGASVMDPKTVVCTGDTFKVRGESKEYTVVVYGDVDKDGSITVLDALALQQYITELDAVQLEAANVVRADGSGVNIVDALHLQQYRAKLTEEIIDKTPAPETAEEPSNYTVVMNEKGIVNNVNIKESKMTIELAEQLEKEQTVTVQLVKEDGTTVELKADVTVPAYTSKVPVDLGDITTKLADFEDGIVNGKIVTTENGKTVTVGTFTFERRTSVLPEAARVTTNRTSTPDATISFVAKGDSDVVKMYYVVKEISEAAPTTLEELTETINVTNNKLENATITTTLENDKAYKVYYVLENSYGSIHDVANIAEAVITKDTSAVTTEKKVAKVEAPVLAKEGENVTTAEFTWELADGEATTGKTYLVTLYKDGKVVEEVPVNAALTTTGFADKMTEAGTYKVAVVVKGKADGTTKDSEATESKEVTVAKLNPVTNIDFAVETVAGVDVKKLTWDSEYDEEAIENYSIQLKVLNDKEYEDEGAAFTVTEKEADISAKITDNKIYKAEITVVKKDGQLAQINSDVATSKEFFTVKTSTITVDDKTEKSVTLKLTTPVTVEGKTTTYDVEVYEVTGEDGTTKPKYTKVDTKVNLAIDKDNNIVVEGLKSNQAYTFKLIANVEGIQGESGFIAETTTLCEMPAIKNLTVVATADEAGANKIVKVAGANAGLNINGTLIKDAEIANYPEALAKINTIMDNLVPNDVITLDGEKLTVKLPNEASASGVYIRDFTDTTAGMILEIEGNKFSKTIQTTAGEDNQPAQVILKGEGAIFNIAGLNADKVVLNNSIVVTTGAQPVTVAAGTTVTINTVKVTAQSEVTLTATGKNLVVTPNNGSNNLTFENTTTGNTNITFKGESGFGSTQAGTITIKSTNGTVTVKGEDMNVASNITVDVKEGEVDITSNTLGGNKNVNVSSSKDATTTVKAIAKTAAPDELKGKTVELKVYDAENEEDMDELKAALGVASVSSELLAKVQEYINAFAINGKGATVAVDATDATKVTITLDNTVEVSNVSISNIK